LRKPSGVKPAKVLSSRLPSRKRHRTSKIQQAKPILPRLSLMVKRNNPPRKRKRRRTKKRKRRTRTLQLIQESK